MGLINREMPYRGSKTKNTTVFKVQCNLGNNFAGITDFNQCQRSDAGTGQKEKGVKL